MEIVQELDGYDITRNHETLALRSGDEIIHEENVSELAEVMFEDVSNDEELEESSRFLRKEIVGNLREKGVPANAANAFTDWAIWYARISR